MASEHHILILEPFDAVVMSGCYVKQKKHPNALIFTEKTIKKGVFNDKDGPWKLHVIAHGVPGEVSKDQYDFSGKLGSKINKYPPEKIAKLIVASGLPNDPKSKVRLDCCFGAITSTSKSLLFELKTKLGKKGLPDVTVEGAVGANILGLVGTKKERIVVKSTQADTFRMLDIWDNVTDQYNRDYTAAKKECASLHASMSPYELHIAAISAHKKMALALKEFRTRLDENKSILIDKGKTKDSYRAKSPYKRRLRV